MCRFDNTYDFNSRGTEHSVPHSLPCALSLQPKQNWFIENTGETDKVYKRNKTKYNIEA
jgi:hypothetical protein